MAVFTIATAPSDDETTCAAETWERLPVAAVSETTNPPETAESTRVANEPLKKAASAAVRNGRH